MLLLLQDDGQFTRLVGAFFLILGICKLHGALHLHEKVSIPLALKYFFYLLLLYVFVLMIYMSWCKTVSVSFICVIYDYHLLTLTWCFPAVLSSLQFYLILNCICIIPVYILYFNHLFVLAWSRLVCREPTEWPYGLSSWRSSSMPVRFREGPWHWMTPRAYSLPVVSWSSG